MTIEFESAKRNSTLPAVPFRWALLFAALLFSGRLAFSMLIRNQELLTTVSNIYMFVEGLVAVASTHYASRYVASRSRQLSKTWTFLTFGMLSILIGNLIWTAISLIYKETPTPSIADLFFVLFYGFTWVGLYNYPLSPQRGGEYKYIWLDNIIVILGSGLLFWVLVISPILKANWGDFSQLNISMAYPIFDLLLLCSLLTFFRNRPEQSTYPPLLLIGLGLTIELAADSFFTYQEMLGTYAGGNFIDLIWSVSFMFCFLAGFAQVSAQNHLPKPIQETRTAQITRQTWPVYLPYFWLVVACALIINSGASPA